MKIRKFAAGVLLAVSLAGIAAAAPPDTSAAASQQATTITGKITTGNGQFFVEDAATQKSVQVVGKNLAKWAGMRVKVTGVITQGTIADPQTLAITSIHRAGMAMAGAGAGTAAAGVKAGVSTAAIAAIGGGATAATVGSLYATHVIGGDDTPVSRQ